MSKKKPTQRLYSRQTTSFIQSKTADNFTLEEMFERFMLDKETEGLTQQTIGDYYIHFNYLLKYLGTDLKNKEITLDVFKGYVRYMLHEKGLSPVTANVRMRTTRALLRYCYLEGWIDEPIHERFKTLKTSEDTLESFTPQEVKELINSIDNSTYRGFRDLVIVYVLLDTMVRCSELIKMKRKNVDLKTGAILLEPHETKTKRARLVPLSIKTMKLLKEYMDLTAQFESGHLFLTYEGSQLADNTIRKNLQEWGRVAGIDHKRVSPHTFRHTGALFYILNGGDPFSLQKIFGHTDMSMVRRYIAFIQCTNTNSIET